MIVVITTRGHDYTVKTFRNGTYGFPAPDVRATSYDRLFRARSVPRATYIFSDLERLSAWELRVAAELFYVLTGAGIRCLNNPSRAKSRVELLQALYREGINPFNVHRADEHPKPARFPVFVRYEADHGRPLTELIADQHTLDVWLNILRGNRVPLRGLIVVEYCGEPYASDLWHKWSTFRVGDRLSVDHIAVDNAWAVKHGDWHKLNDEVVADENDAVVSNRFAEHLKQVFDVAGIDFGRADHATVGARTAVYEINTNPFIGPYVPDSKPLRLQTQAAARSRLGDALGAIDCHDTGAVKIDATPPLLRWRTWRLQAAVPRRP